MISAPWVSVVVPVHNGARFLATALESVLGQADTRVEILVCDDGSTDGSQAIIERFARDSRIRPLDGPKRGNWVANTNAAVLRARGDLITFLHQDDVWLAGRLQALHRAVTRFPEASVWLGPTRYIDANGRAVGTLRLPFGARDTVVAPDKFVEHLLVQNFVGMPTPIFRRSTYEVVGGMDESLWYTADWDLWIKLGGIGGAGLWSQPFTAFRLHGHSQTIRGAARAESMFMQTETVRARHLSRIADPRTRHAVNRAGRLASELNATLATAVGRRSFRCRGLWAGLAGLGLRGAFRFARDARILERSIARLRIGLHSPPTVS